MNINDKFIILDSTKGKIIGGGMPYYIVLDWQV